MTAVEEFELNPIDWDVPLLRANSFVPLKRCYSVPRLRIEPSTDVRKMSNPQLAGQLSQSIATG
jgi:hypothetical protein